MENSNAQVEKYLNDYLSSNFNPGFAVLLQGEWGCGKTWFIKELKDEYEKIKATTKLIYITLYGITNISEINDQIFQQLHPVLSSKEMALAGKLLKGALKATLKVDLNDDNQADGSVSIIAPDIKLPEYLQNTNNCALIFDDLERCSLGLVTILGFINSFVEHQGLKAIIIANEDELKVQEKRLDRDGKIYERIKEKLIAKTFKIKHDVEKVYDTFVPELNNADLESFLSKSKKQIIEIYRIANYNNLRHLKQGLWDFSLFYKDIPKKYQLHPELMNDLISFFFAFNFEIKRGLSLEELKAIKDFSLIRMLSAIDDDTEPTPVERTLRKYDFFKTYDLILPFESWYDLFSSGFITSDAIEASLKNSKYFLKNNQEPWITLWHYREIEDDVFRKTYEKLEEKLNNQEYTIPGDILQIFGIHLKLSDIKLISDDRQTVVSKAKIYIDRIPEDENFQAFCINESDLARMDSDTGWKGLGYAEIDSKEFKTISKYLDEKITEAKTKAYPKVAQGLLNDLKKDVQTFCDQLYLNDNSDKPFYRLPVLSTMDPDSFLKIFYKLSNAHKRKISEAFKRRYRHMGDAELLLKDFNFIQSIKEKIIEESEKHEGSLYGYNLKEIGQFSIGKIHKDLSNIKSKKTDSHNCTCC